MGLADKFRKLMVIDASDQVSYCNRTVQVGPHVLVVTCAMLDSTVPRMRSKHHNWTIKHGGHTIWPTTESLSSYLVASKVADRRRVLELGAGMGVCGLIAHKTGASSVVITDGDATTMKYLRENIMANAPMAGEGKMAESKIEMEEGEDSRPVHARVLPWGDAADVRELMEVLETGQFDMVIGSALVYHESLKKAEALQKQDEKARKLFVTAAAALREGGTLLLAHEIRYDMKEVFEIMEKHSTAVGFGPPRAERMEESPERVVLSMVFNGKVGKADQTSSAAAEKDDSVDDAAQGWIDIVGCMKAIGFGKLSGASRIWLLVLGGDGGPVWGAKF